MKKALIIPLAIVGYFLFNSCKKHAIETENQQNGVSDAILKNIAALGFHTDNVIKVKAGYIVENDILLSEDDLTNATGWQNIKIANTEQYRTTKLVTSLPRTYSVLISATFPSTYRTALQNAIARYNALNLQIKFSYGGLFISPPDLSFPGKIYIKGSDGNYLGSSGFPNSGLPYPFINLNKTKIGTDPNPDYLTSIITHEMGHCIGFRHTDYMDRSYSCFGTPENEGDAGIGAINIPGTPTTPDAASWMLACISPYDNRPFNANDIIALNYLYGY